MTDRQEAIEESVASLMVAALKFAATIDPKASGEARMAMAKLYLARAAALLADGKPGAS